MIVICRLEFSSHPVHRLILYMESDVLHDTLMHYSRLHHIFALATVLLQAAGGFDAHDFVLEVAPAGGFEPLAFRLGVRRTGF